MGKTAKQFKRKTSVMASATNEFQVLKTGSAAITRKHNRRVSAAHAFKFLGLSARKRLVLLHHLCDAEV